MPTLERFGRVIFICDLRPGVSRIRLAESGVECELLIRTAGIRDHDNQKVLPRAGSRIMFRCVDSLAWNPEGIFDGMRYGTIGSHGAVEEILFLRRLPATL